MPDITDLPVMTRADAIAAGFAGYNDVPHKPIDVPDGAFTITAKTSEGRRVTFCFLESTYGGPPRFIDIQFHDRGTTIPNADNGVSPTFNAFAVTGRGRHTSSSALAMPLPGPDGEPLPDTWVVDTPGIRSFGLGWVEPDRVVEAFEDLAGGLEACPRGCTHLADSPGCGLDAWVAQGHAGDAGPARLASLRRLLGNRTAAEAGGSASSED